MTVPRSIRIPAHLNIIINTVYTLGVKQPETGSASYFLASKEGIPGNVDASIRATEGWRGTTDNVSVTALGLVEVTKVEELDHVQKVSIKRYAAKLPDKLPQRIRSADGEREAIIAKVKGSDRHYVSFFSLDRYGARSFSTSSPDGALSKSRAYEAAKGWTNA